MRRSLVPSSQLTTINAPDKSRGSRACIRSSDGIKLAGPSTKPSPSSVACFSGRQPFQRLTSHCEGERRSEVTTAAQREKTCGCKDKGRKTTWRLLRLLMSMMNQSGYINLVTQKIQGMSWPNEMCLRFLTINCVLIFLFSSFMPCP